MRVTNPFLKVHENIFNLDKRKAGSKDSDFMKEKYRQRDAFKTNVLNMFASPEDFCILDTETTGVSNEARIIELSVIAMDGDILFTSLFNPMERISNEITDLTGITNTMVQDAPYFSNMIDELLGAIGNRTIICWNVEFDMRMLKNELRKAGILKEFRSLCAMKGYHAYTRLAIGKWPKLQEAVNECGIDVEQAHRSLSDCIDTLHVLKHCYERIRASEGVLL